MIATSSIEIEDQAVKEADLPGPVQQNGASSVRAVDASAFVGNWINTWRDTKSIMQFTVSASGSNYTIDTYVAGGLRYLGSTEVRPFAPDVDSDQADGFTAFYEFDFLEMLLTAYFVKGLIVVSQYTRFKDGSGRPDYFNREFFFKEGSR